MLTILASVHIVVKILPYKLNNIDLYFYLFFEYYKWKLKDIFYSCLGV